MTKEPTEAQVWHSRYMSMEVDNAKLRSILKEVDEWVRDLEPYADAGYVPAAVFQKVRLVLGLSNG